MPRKEIGLINRINQNQVSEFRQEGQEYAQMFRNVEHGVFGLQGEALAAGCREAAHRTEANIALHKLEKTQDVVQTLLSEMSKVREEQVATSHHCEFLTTELKAERSAAVAAGKTSGNRGRLTSGDRGVHTNRWRSPSPKRPLPPLMAVGLHCPMNQLARTSTAHRTMYDPILFSFQGNGLCA